MYKSFVYDIKNQFIENHEPDPLKKCIFNLKLVYPLSLILIKIL